MQTILPKDSPHRIAVLDDDPSVTRLISHALRKCGFEVVVASTLHEARSQLGLSWDLLLCDRVLPDGDGLEFCEEVRERTGAAFRYVIILSAETSEEAKLAGFACGADDYISKPVSIAELVARVRAGLRIVELQKALLSSNARLERLSRTDELTGLGNRRHFRDEFTRAYEHASRYERPLSVAIVDVDHFKLINDEYGHEEGDRVLEQLGAVLRDALRASDFAARIGGEEFAIILPETQLHEALVVSEKIRRAIEQHPVELRTRPTTISLGVSSIPHSRFTTKSEMLRSADQAMYRAKNRGRNRVEAELRSVPNRPTAQLNYLRSVPPLSANS